MHYIYAIKSEKDGRIYVGMSMDYQKRVIEHNSGKTKSTKGYLPWKLIYVERVLTRIEARTREKFLKAGSGKEFLKGLDLQNAPIVQWIE
ncbi:MAG: endonuclease [Crocinitomicaceae bacterium]|nr:endonuclease [Crocinitomicaceae bacterium]|tara:strand:- start:5147 stop:5416 length:270 start_codon:yes stop_codon:yes gene_type:complete